MLAKQIFRHKASCKWLDLKTIFKMLNASFFLENVVVIFCSKSDLKSMCL